MSITQPSSVNESGFTVVEVIVAIALFIVVLPAIAGMIISAGYINKKGEDYSLIKGIAGQKMESLISKGYDNLPNGTTDFTTELPAKLPPPRSGTYTVSDQDTDLKKIFLTISYTTQGSSETFNFTSYIAKNGLAR